MAITLQFTDGTTTVSVQTASRRALFLPRTAGRDKRELLTEEDGGEMPRTLYRNVEDTAEVHAASQSDLRAIKDDLDRLFETARLRQSMPWLPRVYIQYNPDTSDSSDLYRSEVLTGECDPADRQWTKLSIKFTRRFYWEANSETQVNTSNDVAGSASTNNVFNHNRNASSRNNFLRIAAAAVGGQLAAPARLQLLNNYASGNASINFWIGHTVEGASAFAGAHFLEIENGTYYSGGSTQGSASSSGSNVGRLTWSGTAEAAVWSTSLSSAMLAAAGGNWFRLLARVTAASASDVRIRARVSVDLVTTLWDGSWQMVNALGGAYELGTLQLPSWLANSGSIAPLTLELRARRSSAGAHNVDVDYVQFLPSMSWVLLKTLGYNQPQNVTLHYNPIDQQVYTDGWAGGRIANYAALGGPIWLIPNRVNTIYFMNSQADNVARSTNVAVFYRPRRLTI